MRELFLKLYKIGYFNLQKTFNWNLDQNYQNSEWKRVIAMNKETMWL